MFKRILFNYDENGRWLGDRIYRTLLAEHCNATHFYLWSSGGRDGPLIGVYRAAGRLASDPYNEDGKPPALMFRLLRPTVEFCGSTVEISGFEDPNLSWAGLLTPPYSSVSPRVAKKMPTKVQMSLEMRDQVHRRAYEELHRQAIILLEK